MPRFRSGICLVVAAVLLVGLGIWHPWTSNAEPPGRKGEGFASERFPELPSVAFDPAKALAHLSDLCKIGPRLSGSDGMAKQQEQLEAHFKPLSDQVTWQRFEATQRSQRRPAKMANLVVSWHPERTRRAIVCSHYDTRPFADQETDPRKRRDVFVSANDGTSGVALLMELARHMKSLDTAVGVDFVLFDGEEYVFDRSEDEYFFGSKYFAREYGKSRINTRNASLYVGAILLDMVGGKGARFPVEQTSWKKASGLVRQVWGIADELKCSAFRSNQMSKVAVEDDHVPLNAANIPAIDIIDFDYPHWHRPSDLPENCSAESLEQVARVLTVWLTRCK